MACPKTERCPHPHFQVESSLTFWKSQYCSDDARFEGCARYRMSESGTMPDPKMLPNGKMLDLGDDTN